MSEPVHTRYPFCGVETRILALAGTADRAFGERTVAPYPHVELERPGDRISIDVCVIELRDVSIRAVPGARFHYPEVLWRMPVEWRSEPAWLVLRCDAGPVMRWLVAASDRYNARSSRIELRAESDRGDVRIETRTGSLAGTFRDDGADATWPTGRRVLTRDARGGLFEIPWGDHVPARTRAVRIDATETTLLTTTFDASATLSGHGLFATDRRHECAPARAVR